MSASKLERKSSQDSSTTESFENVDQADAESRASSVNEEADVVEVAGEQEEEIDPLDAPMKREQEQFYTQADSHRAIRTLVMFSSAMFILPLLTMFSLYHYIFIDYFQLPSDQAMLYAGLCGISIVIIIVSAFVYVAYKEEQQAEARQKSLKKD